MEQRKKKLVFLSDFALTRSGFGKNTKLLLEYLYRTNKYEIINVAVGMVQGAPDLDRLPYKCIGSVNPQQLQYLQQVNKPETHGDLQRMAGYGAFSIDNICKQEKPDVLIACQDIWGINFCTDLKYFNNITSILWTTLDSLPILSQAVDCAKKSKHFWSWAEFATKALHQKGKEYEHVKTVRGIIDTKSFYRLSESKRNKLRQDCNIDKDIFIVGYVFRNQLRKSVPNLLEGFSLFKQNNPSLKTKLLLHTHFGEGWNIHKLADEFNINKNDILTTYICRNCSKYEIKSFTNQEIKCPFCHADKGQVTTSPSFGVSEESLNEVYNLMDVYVHPFTSGGQEIPIQEAKLTELVTLVTNYSCGEDSCNPEAGSLSLEYAEYREPGTEFIKASTYPSSISKQLNRVLNMKDSEKKSLGQKGREWVLNNFSIEKIGGYIEQLIDNSALITDYSIFETKVEPKNPNAFIPDISDDEQWICKLYTDILKVEPDKGGGIRHWQEQLKKGMTREQVKQCFVQIATGDNQKIGKENNFEDLLDKNDKKRILLVLPQSAGDIFLSTSLFKSIRKRYPRPEWTLYFACEPQYNEILNGNPNIDKIIPYNQQMDNLIWAEGNASHNGYFDIMYPLHFGTQRLLNYLHSAEDLLDINLRAS